MWLLSSVSKGAFVDAGQSRPETRCFRWASVDSPFGSHGRPRSQVQGLVVATLCSGMRSGGPR